MGITGGLVLWCNGNPVIRSGCNLLCPVLLSYWSIPQQPWNIAGVHATTACPGTGKKTPLSTPPEKWSAIADSDLTRQVLVLPVGNLELTRLLLGFGIAVVVQ